MTRAYVDQVSHRLVNAESVAAGHGPHPAASPFDKRISEHLGLRDFEIYQVELPANGETVQHTHLEDGAEDAYAFITGTGWVVVDGTDVPVTPGDFIAVTVESTRHVRAGSDGLTFIAICSGTTRAES